MIFNTAIPTSRGGSSMGYRIDMTLDGTDVSNVDYNGATATEIAMAVMADPTTEVVFVIDASSNKGALCCRPCMLQAQANPAYGDISTSINAVIPLWYEDTAGDRETYLLQLLLYSENWYANKRTTI